MRRFLINIAVGGGLFLIIIVSIFAVIDHIGLSDYAYKKVLSKTDGSLIVGTSRAAQGLQPAVMNGALVQKGFLPFSNFAFTIIDSPFGDTYYKAIARKISKGESFDAKRLFVVCVDPYSLSIVKELDKDGLREERRSVLRGVPFYKRPNIIYLLRNFELKDWRKKSRYLILHDDGWLEVSVKMDSASVTQNIEKKIEPFRRYTATPSKYRIDGLIKTVRYFQLYGTVYLCRLSTCSQMNEIEYSFWPYFDDDMRTIADSTNIDYFSFVDDYDLYRSIDGNHIVREDGGLISKALCDSILLSTTVERSKINVIK